MAFDYGRMKDVVEFMESEAGARSRCTDRLLRKRVLFDLLQKLNPSDPGYKEASAELEALSNQ